MWTRLQGMVAVACTEAAGFSERVEHMGHAHSSAVLVWSMRDPLRPQLVLHSPGEVFALQANPCRPNLLAGGTFDGQVVLWDMAQALVTAFSLHQYNSLLARAVVSLPCSCHGRA